MEKRSRRSFIVNAGIVGIAPLVAATASTQPAGGKLFHQVYFWLKEQGNEAHRKQLAEGLATLRGIREVKTLHIGMPASTEKRDVVDNSWDVSELMIFDDEAAQKVYQDHVLHQDFIKKYSHLWQKVVVYDTREIV